LDWDRCIAETTIIAVTIFIIDDDVFVRDALQSLIQSLGYAALTFGSAGDFLRFGRVAEAACLIVDVQMPGMSGLELQERLLAEGHDTPVIFMTAVSGKQLRARALDAGALGLLHKPVRAVDLIECLKVALASSAPMRLAATLMPDARANAAFTSSSGGEADFIGSL
jgi:FixJ family two-component response regulator